MADDPVITRLVTPDLAMDPPGVKEEIGPRGPGDGGTSAPLYLQNPDEQRPWHAVGCALLLKRCPGASLGVNHLGKPAWIGWEWAGLPRLLPRGKEARIFIAVSRS